MSNKFDPILGEYREKDGIDGTDVPSYETDPLSLHLDQTTPQTITGLTDGFLKLTSGVLGTGTVDLSAYVPYTGATGSVDLGTHALTLSGGIDIPSTGVDVLKVGTVASNIGVYSTYNKQMVIDGGINTTPNTGNSIKLLISGSSNDVGDNVYPIMVLDENAQEMFWLNGGNTATAGTGYFGGQIRFNDKIILTQTDGNEYIDSLADGYMDYGATTGHRFNSAVDVDGALTVSSVAEDTPTLLKLDQTTPQTITAGRPIFSAGLLSGNTVSETTLIGENAGISITSAVRNIAIGKNALDANLKGNDNIAIGSDALTSMTSAESIAIGNYALKTTVNTLNNVAIGHRAGENINSQSNVFLGSYAGRRLNTSQQNIGIGSFALGSTYSASATGSYNVAIGVSNGEDMTTGYENTLIGFYTGVSLTTGYRNTMVGSQIAKSATTGYRNIIMGELAYTSGTNLGYDNVVLGYENVRRGAGASTRENVLIGGWNAYANIPTNATYGNVFIGYAAAYSLSTGYANAGIGHYSLNGVVDGYKNSSLGSSTLFYCGSGYENVAIGYYAGRLINSGGNSGNLVQSTLLGAETRTNAAGDINSIVIGYAGRGKGSNTAVIGNENTTGLFLPADNYKISFGAGDDCSIYYDATNMVINPKVVGSGILDVLGTLQTDGYNSADGTAGATADVATLAPDGTTTRTLHFKNGLFTGSTDS